MPSKHGSLTRRLGDGGRRANWMPTRPLPVRSLCVMRRFPPAPLGASRCMHGSGPLTRKRTRDRQTQRLQDDAAARGYAVSKVVQERASGLTDHRPKLAKLLTDPTIGTIVVEHQDRLTRFGFHTIQQLLETQGRHIEVLLPIDTDDDLVAVITSMAARMYGRRHSKRRAAQIKACIETVMRDESE